MEDLTDLLHRTNQTMAENEVKLAYFQDISRSKSRQLDMVCTMWCGVALCGAMHVGEFEEKKKCINLLCFLTYKTETFQVKEDESYIGGVQ